MHEESESVSVLKWFCKWQMLSAVVLVARISRRVCGWARTTAGSRPQDEGVTDEGRQYEPNRAKSLSICVHKLGCVFAVLLSAVTQSFICKRSPADNVLRARL